MASEIRVNKIENRSGLGTVTFADTGVDLAGIVTATTFSGSGASLTSLPAAQVTGTLPAISGANLTNLAAANLTGTIADARFPATLPAASAANLTSIPAANVTGTLPALTAANLTNIPAANLVGVCTSGLTKTGGFGKLLSVNEAVKLDTATQSSATFAAISGLQPTVTPTSATSKVLVMINLKIGVSHNYADMCFKLFRSVGGTETQIFSGNDDGDRSTGFFGQQDTDGGVGVYVSVPVSAQFLDSPNTTSEVTYLVKWRVQRSSTYIYLNRSGTDGDDVGNHRNSSSITLMEIAP